jgi:hypothetical protein
MKEKYYQLNGKIIWNRRREKNVKDRVGRNAA